MYRHCTYSTKKKLVINKSENDIMKKDRKRRTWKLNGKQSIDFCDYCFKPGCDPTGGSPKYRRKIEKRLDMGLCPSCGNMPCTCKSRDLPEQAAKERELWIAQKQCRTCTFKEHCVKTKPEVCKKYQKETYNENNLEEE